MIMKEQNHTRNTTTSTNISFGTVIIARTSVDSPTEMELKLRPRSQKIRVVQSLSAGAHFLFTGANMTLALRVYEPHSIATLQLRLQEESQQQNNDTSTTVSNDDTYNLKHKHDQVINKQSHGDDEQDYDGLQKFRDFYKHSIVLFILSTDQLMIDQCSRPDSVLQVAQKTLSNFSSQCHDDDDHDKKTTPQGCSRVFVVQDYNMAMQTIAMVIDSLQPEKRSLKEKFFSNEMEELFIPDPTTGYPKSLNAASTAVSKSFHLFASKKLGIPMDDVNILMHVFQSIGDLIVAATTTTATAKSSTSTANLNDLPIESKTKDILRTFFEEKLSIAASTTQGGSRSQQHQSLSLSSSTSRINNKKTHCDTTLYSGTSKYPQYQQYDTDSGMLMKVHDYSENMFDSYSSNSNQRTNDHHNLTNEFNKKNQHDDYGRSDTRASAVGIHNHYQQQSGFTNYNNKYNTTPYKTSTFSDNNISDNNRSYGYAQVHQQQRIHDSYGNDHYSSSHAMMEVANPPQMQGQDYHPQQTNHASDSNFIFNDYRGNSSSNSHQHDHLLSSQSKQPSQSSLFRKVQQYSASSLQTQMNSSSSNRFDRFINSRDYDNQIHYESSSTYDYPLFTATNNTFTTTTTPSVLKQNISSNRASSPIFKNGVLQTAHSTTTFQNQHFGLSSLHDTTTTKNSRSTRQPFWKKVRTNTSQPTRTTQEESDDGGSTSFNSSRNHNYNSIVPNRYPNDNIVDERRMISSNSGTRYEQSRVGGSYQPSFFHHHNKNNIPAGFKNSYHY